MPPPLVGIDIAKSAVQVHYVDPETGDIANKPVKRAKFLEFRPLRASPEAQREYPHRR